SSASRTTDPNSERSCERVQGRLPIPAKARGKSARSHSNSRAECEKEAETQARDQREQAQAAAGTSRGSEQCRALRRRRSGKRALRNIYGRRRQGWIWLYRRWGRFWYALRLVRARR